MTYARVMGPAAVKVAAQPIGVRGGFFAPCGRRVVSRPFFSVSSFLSRPLDISQLFIHHNICSYVLLFNLRQYEGTYLYLGSYSKDSVAQSPNKCQSSWEAGSPVLWKLRISPYHSYSATCWGTTRYDDHEEAIFFFKIIHYNSDAQNVCTLTPLWTDVHKHYLYKNLRRLSQQILKNNKIKSLKTQYR